MVSAEAPQCVTVAPDFRDDAAQGGVASRRRRSYPNGAMGHSTTCPAIETISS